VLGVRRFPPVCYNKDVVGSEMEFRVRFYATATGYVPMIEWLDELRSQQPTLHALVVAGLTKLKNRDYHGPPLTTCVDRTNKIYELRVGHANIARAFFFFQHGSEIIVTNGYVKHRQALNRKELDRARRYKADWEKRHQ